MEDTYEDIKRKVNSAFCEEKVVDGNPCFDLIKYLIFEKWGKLVVRTEKGEDKEYTSYEELANDYKEGTVHPKWLKTSCIEAINRMIEPVR